MMHKQFILPVGIGAIILMLLSNPKDAKATQIVSPLTIVGSATDMLEDGGVQTNSATGSACPSSSWSKNALTNTVESVRIPVSGSSSFCQRNYYEFNIDYVPNDAVVSQVQFKFEIDSTTNGGRNCDIISLNTNELQAASASTIWSDLSGNTELVNNNSACTSTGVKTLTLSSTANTDLMAQLDDNWFGLGIKMDDESRPAASAPAFRVVQTEHATLTRPQIIITFTSASNTYVLEGSELIEDGKVETNQATGSACPSSTYTKTTSGTSLPINRGDSDLSLVCGRIYFKWDTTNMNDGISNISELIFQFETLSVASALNCDYYPIASDPVAASASALWTDMGDGSVYNSNDATCKTVDVNDMFMTSGARSDLKAALTTTDWWSFSGKFNDETRDSVASHTITMVASERTSGQKPRLIVQTSIALSKGETITITGANTKSIATATINQALSLAGANTKSIAKAFNQNIVIAFDKVNNVITKAFNDTMNILDEFFPGDVIGGGFEIPVGAFALILLPFFIILMPIIIYRRRRRN